MEELLTAESRRSQAQGPADRLAVALDFPSAETALRLVDRIGDRCRWFKVGMELYYAAGNGLIAELRGRGYEVFLDLKLHDIPNTVAGAVRSVTELGAGLLTVHAGGGAAMLRAAAEAVKVPGVAGKLVAPRLLAVTVLTSMDAGELAGVGVADPPEAQVARLAKLAWACGIRGMVCSAEEVAAVRQALGPEALLVTPGIRLAGGDAGDQKRVATPGEAIRRGASMLVVGRPITQATDPAAAVQRVLDEIEAGSGSG